MKQFFNRIFIFFNTLQSNIAFYPTVFAFGGFFFALGMIILEKQGISKYLLDVFPLLVVENGDTALTVLSACIGGLISLMVFSFSMVMLLLSQASSNFSPRLLPGLISDKRHQMILGTYLAAIIYNIFTIFSIQPTGEKYTLPGFSVLLGILFTIVCLASFIYFIHNISQSIQISNILDDIYEEAKERLSHSIEKEGKMLSKTPIILEETSSWFLYKSEQSGYFQNFSHENIVGFCKEHDTKVYITIPKGLFVLENETFLKSKNQLDNDQLKSLYANISFSRRELVSDNYTLAFKQITEIAVKAMSPGINDPGTAVNAIDYLTELFAFRMKKKDVEIYVDEKETAYFKLEVIPFDVLLYNVMASLRTYCKHDPIIVQKLLWMLHYLEKQSAFNNDYHSAIDEEIKVLKRDAKSAFERKKDRKILK